MIGDKELDRQLGLNTLTDYAQEYGDQATIETMLEWLHTKMGGEWVITRKDE